MTLCTHTTNNINGFSGENVVIRKLWESLFPEEKRKNATIVQFIEDIYRQIIEFYYLEILKTKL